MLSLKLNKINSGENVHGANVNVLCRVFGKMNGGLQSMKVTN
jgi:hypothetical protein